MSLDESTYLARTGTSPFGGRERADSERNLLPLGHGQLPPGQSDVGDLDRPRQRPRLAVCHLLLGRDQARGGGASWPALHEHGLGRAARGGH